MTVIVGRNVESARLHDAIARLADGRGGIAWIEGEPGIGKTALVDATAEAAVKTGCRVLRGGGDELMQAFPLRMIADALDVSARAADPARVLIARLLRGEAVGAATFDPVLAAGSGCSSSSTGSARIGPCCWRWRTCSGRTRRASPCASGWPGRSTRSRCCCWPPAGRSRRGPPCHGCARCCGTGPASISTSAR
ncbi:AAA family ATPase [Catellatospora coxensis]